MSNVLMHLMQIMDHSNINQSVGAWRHPDDVQGRSFHRAQFWRDVAVTAERGFFDGVFIADLLGAANDYQGSPTPTIERGVNFPIHDPMPLVPTMAGVTEHLGIAVTLSTAAYNPYIAARSFATLAHLSEGRVGWNVVTSHRAADYANLGEGRASHEDRYARAEEFLALCTALWESSEPDSAILDAEAGVFSDASKVHQINFQGNYFKSAGPLSTLPVPKRARPVIFQAGASKPGMAFSGKHAEGVFSIQMDAAGMADFSRRLHDEIEAAGRPTRSAKILFGLQTFVAESEAKAVEKRDFFNSFADLEGSVARLSATFARDFSTMDLDADLENETVEGNQGLVDAATRSGATKQTIRELALRFGQSYGAPQLVGTGTQVAEQMVELMNAGGGDGFTVMPTVLPSGQEDFVERVVPELQRIGAYRTRYCGDNFRAHLEQETPDGR